MENSNTKKGGIHKMETIKRKAVRILQEELVKKGYLRDERNLPLLIQPAVEGVDLISWAANNRELIETELLKHGAILFRNFTIGAVTEFERFIKTLAEELLDYRERSSPRSHVSGGIYTSTEYPPNQSIFLHNENSYAHIWPSKLFFFCHTPAQKGGETPIADCRKVLTHIDPTIIERFSQKKVMYVRNFRRGFGLSWETVFQTSNKSAVEEYCSKAGYEFEWMSDNCLRTRRIGQAIIKHPRTGQMVWFNHAAFFHISTLEAVTQEALLTIFKEEDLPNNTYYGDGSPIEASVLNEIREAYYREMVIFPWQPEDILMLDNMSTAHGRMPFVGQRRVLVGMADPYLSGELPSS
jgi:alpha-ketoglutarate-dependent taurine dioxygenase